MAYNSNYSSTDYDKTFTEQLNSPLTNFVHHSNTNQPRNDAYQYRPENHPLRCSSSRGRQNTSVPPFIPQHDLQDIIRNATHFTLMAAGNEAHTGIFNDYMRIKYQFEAQKELFSELKEQLKESQRLTQNSSLLRALNEDTNNQSSSRTSTERPTIKIPPALHTEDEEDHPEVRFWNKKEWSDFETRATMRNDMVDKFGFLCDESGKRVSRDRLEEMTDLAKVTWNELYHWRLDPTTWMKRNEQASQYFSATMGKKFPEFRWCQGDWKLNEFAKFRYPDWKRYYRQPGVLSRDRPSKGKRKADEDALSTTNQPKRKRRNNTIPPSGPVIDLCSDGDAAPAPSSCDNASASSSIAPSSHTAQQAATPTATPLMSLDVPPPGRSTSNSSPAATDMSHSSSTTSSLLPVRSAETAPENATSTPLTPPTGGVPSTTSATAVSITVGSGGVAEETTLEPPPIFSPAGTTQVPDVPSMASSLDGEAAQVACPPRRVRMNPLAGLSIPRPASEVSQPESAIQSFSTAAPPKPKRGGKLMKASETLLTAQNLYAIDYLKEHAEEPITVAQFRDIYKQLDSATIKRYEELSKEKKAATAAKIMSPSEGSS